MSKFSEDINRYRALGSEGRALWLNPAVWAVASYRMSNWLLFADVNPLVRIPLKLFAYATTKFCEIFMEMCIDPQATIGGGLYIGHIGGVHINPQAVLGKNCDIGHRVTIGASGRGRKGVPILGDNVYVGTGATLVGKIRVGSGAMIAANTLVLTSVPEGATIVGVPGQVVMLPPKKAATLATAPSLVSHDTSGSPPTVADDGVTAYRPQTEPPTGLASGHRLAS